MKKIVTVIAVLFFITSCELTDVLDNDPPNNLIPENVVKNEEDAKALLNGVYSTMRSDRFPSYYLFTELIPSSLIGSMGNLGFGPVGQFSENDLLPDNSFVRNFWIMFYKVIDQTNNVLNVVGTLPDSEFSEGTKAEIIGEAHYLRAMATFDALRYFGQFYDENSSLGIILKTEPANFVTRHKARSTVAESYAQIIADLDVAIATAPSYAVTYKASRTAAKALKARVLLFQGKYAEAAVQADEVINEGTTSLEADFESTFSNGFSSSEMIFMLFRDANSDDVDRNQKEFYRGIVSAGWFADLMETDPRKEFTFNGFGRGSVLKTNHEATFRPTYFLRLAEMYLIKAEGLAFSGASLMEASAPLNSIRNRATIGDTPALTMDELKDDIFNEIVRELAFENGSEWFAAIRFDKAMTLKPTITSINQYILPIPLDEIFANGALTLADQNPGYDGQ